MNVRQKESVLLALDEAFGVRRAGGGGPTSSATNKPNQAGFYQGSPSDLMEGIVFSETDEGKTVEAAIGELFLKSRGPTAEERLRGKTVMLDNTKSQTDQQSQETRVRRQLLRKRRRLGVSIPEESDKKTMREGRGCYNDYVNLHTAWEYYAREVLGLPQDTASSSSSHLQESDNTTSNPQQIVALQKKLLTADLHGCHLRVSESKCHSDVGIAGVVIRESKTAFHLMTLEDKVKILPKKGRRFVVELAPYRISLHGNGLVDRHRAITSPYIKTSSSSAGGMKGKDERYLVNTQL